MEAVWPPTTKKRRTKSVIAVKISRGSRGLETARGAARAALRPQALFATQLPETGLAVQRVLLLRVDAPELGGGAVGRRLTHDGIRSGVDDDLNRAVGE